MKKSSRPVITGIITAVILLAALVSCGNLNIRKQATIVISFGNARSVISYQKSDTAYYMISLQPEVQQPKRVEATQNAAEITGLEEGTYTLLVKAYNANDELIAEGRAENIQVAAGETAAATVQMEAKTYHGHEWDNGTETKAATCTETGILTYTCTDCHETKTEIIPAQGHVWSNYVYDENSATEEHAGTKTRECIICHTTETLPANGPYTLSDEFSFTETIQPAPADYIGSMGETGSYVIFGDFPQTVAPVGFDINPHPEENGYYIGEDGYYYEKVLENAVDSSYSYSDNSSAKQKNTNPSSYRYFKIEPIVWRVVTTTYDIDGSSGETTGALLLAENELMAIQYFDSTDSRSIEGINDSIPPYNYEHSTIRAYLNGLSYYTTGTTQENKYDESGFLQKAFSLDASERIMLTIVKNNIGSTGNDTKDKIFVLSEDELKETEYGFTSDSTRIRKVTDYCITSGSGCSTERCASFWTRTFSSGSSIKNVDTTGSFGIRDANITSYTVVPALTVPVSALPQ